MSNSSILFSDLKSGRCSSTVQVWFRKFWFRLILLLLGILLFDFTLRVDVVRLCSYGLYLILLLVFVSGSFNLDL